MQQGSSGGQAGSTSRRLSSTCPMSSSSSSSTAVEYNNDNKENKRALTAVLSEDGTSTVGGSVATMQQQQKQSSTSVLREQHATANKQMPSPQIRQSFLSKLTKAEFSKQPSATSTAGQQQQHGSKATFSKSLNQCDTTTSTPFSFSEQQNVIGQHPQADATMKDVNNNNNQQATISNNNNNMSDSSKQEEKKRPEEEVDDDDDDNLVIPAWPSRSDTLGHKKSEFVQHKVYSLKDYSQVANPTARSTTSSTTSATTAPATNSSSSGNKLLKSMSQDRKVKTSAKRMSECIYPPQNIFLGAPKTGRDNNSFLTKNKNNPSLPVVSSSSSSSEAAAFLSGGHLAPHHLISSTNSPSVTSASFSIAPGGPGLLPTNSRYANFMTGESKIDRMRKLFVSPLSLRSSSNSSGRSHQSKQQAAAAALAASQQPQQQQQQQQHSHQHQHQGRLSFQSSIAMAGMLNKPHHMIHAMYVGGRQGFGKSGVGTAASQRRSPMRKGQKGSVKSFRVYGCPLQMANNIYPITCFGRADIYKQQAVPYVLARLCNYIEENSSHLTHEGIFRVSGNARLMEKLRTLFDRLGDAPLESESVDVATSASMLKMYLRELPEPLIPTRMNYYFITLAKKYALYLNSLKESNNFNSGNRTLSSAQQQQQLQQSSSSSSATTTTKSSYNNNNNQNRPSIQSTTCGESSISSHSFHSDQSSHQLSSIERQKLAFSRDLTKLLRKLPIENYNLLKYLACFLYRISLKQQYNKMCAEALGIVFGPNVFRIRSESYKGLKEQELSNQIMASIISNYKSIFDSELTDPLGNLVLENQHCPVEQQPSSSSMSTVTSTSSTIAAPNQQSNQKQREDSNLNTTTKPMELDYDIKTGNENNSGGIKVSSPLRPVQTGAFSGHQRMKSNQHGSCCPEHCQGCLLDQEPSEVDFNPSNKEAHSALAYDDDDDDEDDEEDDDGEEEAMNSEDEEEDCDVEGESYTPSSGSGSYCSSMNSETLESSDYDEENEDGDDDDDDDNEINQDDFSDNNNKFNLRHNSKRGGHHHHRHHHHHNHSSSSDCPSDTSYTPTSSHSDDNDSDPANDGGEESMNYDDEDGNSSSFDSESPSSIKRYNQREQHQDDEGQLKSNAQQQHQACVGCKPKTESSTQTPLMIPGSSSKLVMIKNQDESNRLIEIEQQPEDDANKTICDKNNNNIVNQAKEDVKQQNIPTTTRQSCRRKHQHELSARSGIKKSPIESDGQTRNNELEQISAKQQLAKEGEDVRDKAHHYHHPDKGNIKQSIKNLDSHKKNSLSHGKFDFIRGRSSSASSLGRMKRTRDKLAAAHHQGKKVPKGSHQNADEQNHNHSMDRRKLIQYHHQQQASHSRKSTASFSHRNQGFSRSSGAGASGPPAGVSTKLTSLLGGTTYPSKCSSKKSKKATESTKSKKTNIKKQQLSSATTNDEFVEDDDEEHEETLCCDNVSALNLTPQRLMQDLGWDFWSTNYLEELEYDKYFLLRSFNSDETLLHSSSYYEFEPELCAKVHRRFSGNDFLNVKQHQQLLPITYANHPCEQIFESCLEAEAVLKEFVMGDYVKVVDQDNNDDLNHDSCLQQDRRALGGQFKTSCISLIDQAGQALPSDQELGLQHQQQQQQQQQQQFRKEGLEPDEAEQQSGAPSNELKQSILSFNVTDNSSISFNAQFEDVLETQMRALKDLVRLLRKVYRRITQQSPSTMYNKKCNYKSSKELRLIIEKLNISEQNQYLDDYSACSVDYLSAQSVYEQFSWALKEYNERQLKEANELIKSCNDDDDDKKDRNADHDQEEFEEEEENRDHQLIDDMLEFKMKLLKQRYTDLRKIREHYLRNHSTVLTLNNATTAPAAIIMSTSSLSGHGATITTTTDLDNKQILTSQRNAPVDDNNSDNISINVAEQLTSKIMELALQEHNNAEQLEKQKQQQNSNEELDDESHLAPKEESKVHDKKGYCIMDTPVTSSSNLNSSSLSTSFMRLSTVSGEQRQQQENEGSEFRQRKLSAPSSSSSGRVILHHRYRYSNDNNSASTHSKPNKCNLFYGNKVDNAEEEEEEEENSRDKIITGNVGKQISDESKTLAAPFHHKDRQQQQLDFMESSAASSQQYLATSGESGSSLHEIIENKHKASSSLINAASTAPTQQTNKLASQQQSKPLQSSHNNYNHQVVSTCKYGSLCPIEFVYNIEKQLASKRVSGGRIVKLNDMSMEQLLNEKLELQKNLLRYEHWFGRPLSKLDYSLVGHLYERYRAVKLIILTKRNNLTSSPSYNAKDDE